MISRNTTKICQVERTNKTIERKNMDLQVALEENEQVRRKILRIQDLFRKKISSVTKAVSRVKYA